MKNEERLYLIKEASRKAEVTAETLRHYDRIGLIKPVREENGYRFYTEEQIIIISIIKRLQSIGFSLEEIDKIFALDDLAEVKNALIEVDKKCSAKINELKETKKIIKRAIEQYSVQTEENLTNKDEVNFFQRRYILLSKTLKEVNVETLYNYQYHYKKELGEKNSDFKFKDKAGIYIKSGIEQLFIECEKPNHDDNNLVILPKGNYLCLFCKSDEKEETIKMALKLAKEKYNVNVEEIVVLIEVLGITKWGYSVQIKIS